MRNMVSLEKLWVDDNPLTDLPSGLGRLKRLKTVDFTPGPGWVGPPAAVIRGGTANLLEWLRNRGPEPQRRAKLVIVGEGGVGKTSLVKALTGKPHDREEPRTHGLSVQELAIEHPENADVVMRLSAWDFGGQQIYQGTHQFFLTDHCLVVLVWNARQEWEKGDLGKWLDVIEARAPKAAVLLVATHCAGSAADMPPASLLVGYRQITGCFTVDCAARTGIDELRDGLAEQASRLRIMRAAWPATWLRAREACRDADRDYVSRGELYQLFANAGVGEPGRQWELARGLTELGEILDGSQEEQPYDVVVLRPEWLSTQISKILDSSEVTARGGLLTRQDMAREWAGIEPAVRDHLLDMMDRFDLSYRVDSRDRDALAVVVDCLSKDPPADLGREWETGRGGEAREIRMRYHLPGLLPPGIPTWFIAREHRFATGLRWRHGVLLRDARGENLGLLTADRQRGVIDLAVRGPQPGPFWRLLDDGLTETFDRYPGLTDRVRREVPCSCRGTEPPGCSQLYDYDDLNRALRDGHTVQCHVSGKLIDVTELLYGIPPAVVMSDRALTSDEFERGINRILAAQDAQTSQILSATDEGPELIRYLFTKTWQQMRTNCPNVFTLTKKRRVPGVASSYTLRLYCNEPDEWHALRDGGGCFEFTEVDDWLLNLASPLNKLLAVLKCVTPFAVPVLGLAAAGLHSQLKDDMDRMQNLLRELPGPVDLPEGPLDDLPDDVRHADAKPRSYASTDAEFRRLATFLEEKVPPRDRWGGLSQHVTPEGDTLYLCPEHLARYMAPARDGQRLQVHTGAGSRRVNGTPTRAASTVW